MPGQYVNVERFHVSMSSLDAAGSFFSSSFAPRPMQILSDGGSSGVTTRVDRHVTLADWILHEKCHEQPDIFDLLHQN